MSNNQLRAIAGAEDNQAGSFPALLKKAHAEIARALPRHINADRMARIALTCYRQNPTLAKCEPLSVLGSVIQSSQLGLEPGLNGRAYLVPYYNNKKQQYECQFIPGWKGLVELVNRTGRASCWTGAVFKGDDFDYALGDSPYVKHRPGLEDDPAQLEYAYAVGRVKGGEWANIEVWTNAKIAKHRDRYNKVGKIHYSYENWEMYARKVPLMQVLKYLPSSPELEAALTLNDAAEMGLSQGITIDGAIQHPMEPETSSAGDVDRETGEITSGGIEPANPAPDPRKASPVFIYAEVTDALHRAHKARDAEAFALARDMIRGVGDERQRAELDIEAKRLAKDLG